ncbi:MAG: dicarboxylate/amino acid:cation symporter [Gammaproteobacteria bacterium]|nr:dicarboxylate/amino acid:cation symporter [Gammaproteobacteria bacterium]MDE0246463.1 dicarboxylate/amino acid:cation symporter [Gammaproteobacteria bacterium]MDE0395857.1 dicarboxylate/amino acid:cation symporter [Gammaproteobacteria bacterium]
MTASDRRWYRRLHWQVLTAMVLGVATGAAFGEEAAVRIGWVGALFMELLRMVIIPLVMASIISGVATAGGGSALGRLFSKTLGYILLSSGLAAIVGLIAVNLIRPGAGSDFAGAARAELPELPAPNSVVGLLLDIVPENVVAAAAGADMLAVIFFSIVFGAAIALLPDRTRTVLTDLFDALFQTMMRLTAGIILFLPIGIYGLITAMVGTTGLEGFGALALYAATILSGLAVHLLVLLPLLLVLLGGIRPATHFRKMREPLLVAFSTGSSTATLPVTMAAVEKKAGVPNRIGSFVLPLGATVNMDGTAVFECVGAVFIAQALGFDLTVVQQLIVVLTAVLASIGAATVPSAGLVMIFIVLEAINLRGPEVDLLVGAMLAIDRPLDMCRTAVNVFSDSCGAALIAQSEGAAAGGMPRRPVRPAAGA